VAGDARRNFVGKAGRTSMQARRYDEDDHVRRRQGSLMSPTQQLLHNNSPTTPSAGKFSRGTKARRRQRYNKQMRVCVNRLCSRQLGETLQREINSILTTVRKATTG